jgi:hypothetical protein
VGVWGGAGQAALPRARAGAAPEPAGRPAADRASAGDRAGAAVGRPQAGRAGRRPECRAVGLGPARWPVRCRHGLPRRGRRPARGRCRPCRAVGLGPAPWSVRCRRGLPRTRERPEWRPARRCRRPSRALGLGPAPSPVRRRRRSRRGPGSGRLVPDVRSLGGPGCRRRRRGRWPRPQRRRRVRPRLLRHLLPAVVTRLAPDPQSGDSPAPAFHSPDAPTRSSSSLRPAASGGRPARGRGRALGRRRFCGTGGRSRFKQLYGPTGTARTGAAPWTARLARRDVPHTLRTVLSTVAVPPEIALGVPYHCAVGAPRA